LIAAAKNLFAKRCSRGGLAGLIPARGQLASLKLAQTVRSLVGRFATWPGGHPARRDFRRKPYAPSAISLTIFFAAPCGSVAKSAEYIKIYPAFFILCLLQNFITSLLHFRKKLDK
jgi:hypothetical protein